MVISSASRVLSEVAKFADDSISLAMQHIFALPDIYQLDIADGLKQLLDERNCDLNFLLQSTSAYVAHELGIDEYVAKLIIDAARKIQWREFRTTDEKSLRLTRGLSGLKQAFYILKSISDGRTRKEIIEEFDGDEQLVWIWMNYPKGRKYLNIDASVVTDIGHAFLADFRGFTNVR